MMQKIYFILLLLSIQFLSFSQGPTVDFNASTTTACVGENITFTSTSTQGTSPIISYNWDFGDGNNATNSTVTHSYNAPGQYIITLVATDQNTNANSKVKLNYITINPNPTANFTYQSNGCLLPSTINLTNQSTPSLNYNWDFGNSQLSTVFNPSPITYTNTGTYQIKLDVTNPTTNCKASITKSINIANFKTDFNNVDTICAGNLINMSDNSSIGVNQWNWSSSDGQLSNIQNPSFSFFNPGTYTINLTSSNTNNNCSDSKTKTIVVIPLPLPTFSANTTSGCSPLNVTFTNTTTTGQNYQWNFGDGSSFSGFNPPNHSYLTDGNFNVSLTTTGIFGCTNTTTFYNYISTKPAIADFQGLDSNGCTPLNVNFTDLSNSSNPTDDPIISWQWNLSNGNTYNGQTPPLTPFTTGLYSISLTITTQKGCTATKTKNNYIKVGSIDQINYSYTPPIECAKTAIHFTDQSVISATHDPNEIQYDWDFGEPGGKSSQQNPDYSYSNDTGYFDVQLIINFRGCKDTIIKDSAVYIKAPISKFNPTQTLFCNPSSFPVQVDVTDNAIIGQASDDVKMIWRWGDAANTTTILEDPDLDPDDDGSSNFNYSDYGTYTIKQVVYNYTTGCKDSTTNTIVISEIEANFTMNNDSICKNSIANFTDNSNSVNSIISYDWDFADGTHAYLNPASHQFMTSGQIPITLTVTNDKNCSSSTNKILNVLELPKANLSPSTTVGCSPINVTYTNTSSPQGNGYSNNPIFSNFQWTFPNGAVQSTTSINTSKNFNYTTEGNFLMTLVATDNFGCISLPKSVPMLITKPTPNFIIDSVVCNKINIIAINNSTGYGNLNFNWKVDNISKTANPNFNYTFNELNNNTSINNIPHTIMLEVTDANGCINTLSKNIKVSLPQANLTYNFTGANINNQGLASCPPVFGAYQNQSNVYTNTYNSYWNFGDGKYSTLKNPNNTYVFSGKYSLSMYIVDNYNCSDTIHFYDYLTISGPKTETNIIDSGDPCNSVLYFDTLVTSDIHHLYWDFGDGKTSNKLPANHIYNQNGTYYPILHIFDNNNCEVLYKDTITVYKNNLNANFKAFPNTASFGTQINFQDNSSATLPISTWKWEFGDENNSSLINFNNSNTQFTYPLPGYYTVNLIITDGNNCTDKYTSIIHITGDVETPNVFTPNGDGVNDNFEFPIDIFKSYDVLILDRWGSAVYSKKNVTGTLIWNGFNQNKEECTDGVYFFKINGLIKDGTPFEKTGFLTKIK